LLAEAGGLGGSGGNGGNATGGVTGAAGLTAKGTGVGVSVAANVGGLWGGAGGAGGFGGQRHGWLGRRAELALSSLQSNGNLSLINSSIKRHFRSWGAAIWRRWAYGAMAVQAAMGAKSGDATGGVSLSRLAAA